MKPQRLSPVVIEHIMSLLQPIQEVTQGIHSLTMTTKPNLSQRETQLFWRYHGHFPQEFVKAIETILPHHYHFIEYDHLNNQLTVEVK